MSRTIDPREQHARRSSRASDWVTLHIPSDFEESVRASMMQRDYRREQVLEARRAGHTLQEIADRFGVSRQAVGQMCRRGGVLA